MILLNGEKKSFPRSDRMKAIKFILVFVLNFSSTFKVSHELKKRWISNAFRRSWILPAAGLTDRIRTRTGSSPFLQQLPSTLGRKNVGEKSEKSRSSMTLLLQAEVCKSRSCSETTPTLPWEGQCLHTGYCTHFPVDSSLPNSALLALQRLIRECLLHPWSLQEPQTREY